MAKSMNKATSRSSASSAPWLGVAFVVILFDQLAKIAVTRVLVYGRPYPVTSFFDLLLLWGRTRLPAALGNLRAWRASSYSPLTLDLPRAHGRRAAEAG